MIVHLESQRGDTVDLVHEMHLPAHDLPDAISFGGRMFYRRGRNGDFHMTYREVTCLTIELPNAEVGSDGVTVIRATDK